MKTVIIADNQPASGTGAFTVGGPIILNDTSGYYIQAVGSAAGTAGTLTIQHSTDGEMWSDNSSTITIAGTTAEGQDITTPSKYLRVSYADTGAIGNVTIKMNIIEQ